MQGISLRIWWFSNILHFSRFRKISHWTGNTHRSSISWTYTSQLYQSVNRQPRRYLYSIVGYSLLVCPYLQALPTSETSGTPVTYCIIRDNTTRFITEVLKSTRLAKLEEGSYKKQMMRNLCTSLETFKILLIRALHRAWAIQQWDIIAAYLQALLKHDVYTSLM